ncbi:MAG TPA: Flp pilus assembly protein CpaB [Mycobacteriales bacterium]|nr:Flp pilus assembly protein CpaB [Mycobacteriales bacterium]
MRAHELQRHLRRHRALLAGLLTATGVLAALPALAPAAGPSVLVVAAARDLAPGRPLTAEDLTTIALPRDVAPSGVLTTVGDAVGRTATSAVRRGEPLTDVRLLGAGLLTGHGLVAAPLRLADPATLALLHAGDRVDVLAAPTSSDGPPTSAVTVAAGVRVLAVPGGEDATAEGGLVVVAATPATAARLAAAAVSSRLSVTLLPAG